MIRRYKSQFEVNETLSFSCKGDILRSESSESTCSAEGTWIPPPTCVSTTVCPGFAPFIAGNSPAPTSGRWLLCYGGAGLTDGHNGRGMLSM